MNTTSFYTQLTYESILSVTGPEAKRLLQGQITCNLDDIKQHHSSIAAQCNAKGRVLSTFRIVQQSEKYLLTTASNIAQMLIQDLKKYAIFFKVEILDETKSWVRFGLFNPSTKLLDTLYQRQSSAQKRQNTWHTLDLIIIQLDTKRFELWIPSSEVSSIQPLLEKNMLQAPINTWLLAQIRAGIAQIFLPTRELFIPQMLNLHAIGAVSFKKGCYTGQEVIARMHYLGKLKRQLYYLKASSSELPQIGDLIVSNQNTTVGTVILSAKSNNSHVEFLAVLLTNLDDFHSIHLDSNKENSITYISLLEN